MRQTVRPKARLRERDQERETQRAYLERDAQRAYLERDAQRERELERERERDGER